jgi:DNA recombination protein RmuC
MFRSPKLRGQWGELSLGSILKEYFPRGGYQEQYYFKSGEAVDAIVRLPNGLILPIDSKFNWDNFQKMTEAESEAPRAAYRKAFLSDVKKKVDEIATKYVLPSEETTDLALMYVPAEAIYYEIIQSLRDEDVTEYARKRKILLCSPNTLYITLTAVTHWFKDAQVQKQTREIIKKLETVIKDAGTLSDDFRKLGDHLSSATSAYERSDKKLGHLVERTQKVIDMGQEQEQLEVE